MLRRSSKQVEKRAALANRNYTRSFLSERYFLFIHTLSHISHHGRFTLVNYPRLTLLTRYRDKSSRLLKRVGEADRGNLSESRHESILYNLVREGTSNRCCRLHNFSSQRDTLATSALASSRILLILEFPGSARQSARGIYRQTFPEYPRVPVTPLTSGHSFSGYPSRFSHVLHRGDARRITDIASE